MASQSWRRCASLASANEMVHEGGETECAREGRRLTDGVSALSASLDERDRDWWEEPKGWDVSSQLVAACRSSKAENGFESRLGEKTACVCGRRTAGVSRRRLGARWVRDVDLRIGESVAHWRNGELVVEVLFLADELPGQRPCASRFRRSSGEHVIGEVPPNFSAPPQRGYVAHGGGLYQCECES